MRLIVGVRGQFHRPAVTCKWLGFYAADMLELSADVTDGNF